jgi:uncharacterized DUF497 family protein
MDIFDNCEGFEWDEGNSDKNRIKHRVSKIECEQVFFNVPFIIADDEKHSQKENRWYLLGRTDLDRRLFLVFTIRGNLIRVISARSMNKKESEIYDKELKKNT